MQFQINGQPHFLNFEAGEGRWFMYVPSASGMQRVPVADDGHMHFDKFVIPPETEN